MPELSPSIVCCNGTFKEMAAMLNYLRFPRLHVDVADGAGMPGLIPIECFGKSERQLFEAPIDLHIFDFSQRWEQEELPVKSGDSVVFHLFPWATSAKISELADKQLPDGVEKGIAIDTHASLNTAIAIVPRCTVVTVMGIEAGGRGLPLNEHAVERLKMLRNMTEGRVRLVIDGGVNVDTFPRLACLADTIIIGSLLFNAPNLEAQWSHLQQWLRRLTRLKQK